MEIEKYFLKINPKQVLSRLIEERVSMAEENLSLAEKLIREKLGDKVSEINLQLWIGNSTKSVNDLIEFIKLLESKGMEKKDLNFVKELMVQSSILLGFV